MHTQLRRHQKHSHGYHLDRDTNELVCLCGKIQGVRLPNKFNAISSIYNGIPYDSRFEASYAQELDWRLRSKEIVKWERQVPIRLEVNGHLVKTTKVDFLVHHKDGSKELVETKGMETEAYKITKKLIEATFLHDHPEYRYTVIKEWL